LEVLVRVSLGVKPSLKTKEDSLQVERLAGDCLKKWLNQSEDCMLSN